MHLVQIFLPLYTSNGKRIPAHRFATERKRLIDRYGGLTAYNRGPVKGLWKEKGRTERDDLVIFEVMIERLLRHWWSDYRKALEQRFEQKEILIRVQKITRL